MPRCAKHLKLIFKNKKKTHAKGKNEINFVQTRVQGQESCSYVSDIGQAGNEGEALVHLPQTEVAQVLENTDTSTNTPRLEVGWKE